MWGFEVSEANRKAKCLEIKAYDYMVRFEAGRISDICPHFIGGEMTKELKFDISDRLQKELLLPQEKREYFVEHTSFKGLWKVSFTLKGF